MFSMLTPENVHVVTFGTCGVVPRELDVEYPFMNYSFMMGQCNVAKVKRDFLATETKRLAEYLERTKDNYKYRIAYCIGDFREAMVQASGKTGIFVNIVPKEETIEKNIQPNKKFIYNSLSCSDYLSDFSAAISKAIDTVGIVGKKHVEIVDDADFEDSEWYE